MNAYYQGAVRFEGRSGYNIPLDAVVDIGWVVPENEEIWSRTIGLVLRNDGHWYVFHVATPGQDYPLAYIYNNKVIYCNDNCVPKDSVSGIIENDLRYFSLSAFPKSPDKARETLSTPPEIPEGELEAENIKLTGGKKYSVYSGPSENYLRGGNGKAAVSTNDWIQVFGKENGWILIQYDISSDHMRFGYIGAKIRIIRYCYTSLLRRTFLGRHQHYAIRATGTVDSRRRRIFEHRNGLDVLRTEVADVATGNTVYHIQRFVAA
jgi:hypothetical protein